MNEDNDLVIDSDTGLPDYFQEVTPESNPLTKEQLMKALPDRFKKSLNDELINQIMEQISNPMHYEMYRDNLLSFSSVVQQGRRKLPEYVNAVKFCTHKLMGKTNIDSFVAAFPDRFQSMVDKGYSNKDINSYVSAYNKSVMVTEIMKQSLVPTYILNQDLYQRALNSAAELMENSSSDMAKAAAIGHLLNALKQPDEVKVNLDVGTGTNDAINSLRSTIDDLVIEQRKAISSGRLTAKDVAVQTLKRVEVEDV